VSTAPCQSAGNNCANDSNMMIDLEKEVCVRAVGTWDVVRETCETAERRGTGAFYRFKSDEPSSSGKRCIGGQVTAPGKRRVNDLVARLDGAFRDLPSGLSLRTMAA
jgi:hypothetical protein